jgi:hypothetical protein
VQCYGLRLWWSQWGSWCFLLTFIGWFGSGRGTRLSYCQECGLDRSEKGFTCFGRPLGWQVKYRETDYHKVYGRLVPVACNHKWRIYSRSTLELGMGLMGTTGVGCSPYPYSLLHSKTIPRLLLRLRDQSKAAAVVRSFDLSMYERNGPVYVAVSELNNVIDVSTEEQWWKKYRVLFLKPMSATDKERWWNTYQSQLLKPKRANHHE